METILVVEDEDGVRNLVQNILARKGYHVLQASNAMEAIALVEQYDGTIDLLLTDIVMPVINGWELSKRLLLLRPKMKVVYMSGYTGDLVLGEEEVRKKKNFLQKPFSLNALLAKMEDILNEA